MSHAQRGRMGAHALHAAGKTNTAPARAAMQRRFETEVDPDGTLSPAERAKRVAHAKSLYFARLSYLRWRNAQDDVASGNVWPEEA